VDLSAERIAAFQREVLDWFAAHGRDLPWRHTRDPYHILVSEIMLQQTRVERVLPKYSSFLASFPTVSALAVASAAEVLRAWRGLGYNRRALYVKRTAEIVHFAYGGQFPREVEVLERLPGIGHYTAHAIACFAFDAQVPVVDTNVRQVLSWFVDPSGATKLSPREAEAVAAQLLPPGRAWEWNQALMDYGALTLSVRYSGRKARTQEAVTPFKFTDRFWRGRILDALRDTTTEVAVQHLLRELPEENRDEYRIRSLIRVLNKEGLVRYDANADTACLPE
jgi:A/G-specific adenine glycosylase